MSWENRMFDEMMKAARQRLAGRDRKACRCSLFRWDISISKLGGSCDGQLSGLRNHTGITRLGHALVFLHYLDLAEGSVKIIYCKTGKPFICPFLCLMNQQKSPDSEKRSLDF